MMKTLDLRSLTAALGKNKYVLLVMVLGLVLILLPSGGGTAREEMGEAEYIADFLSALEDVGDCRVLLSQNGAVIACTGAEEPAVRLKVINAVESYTGLRSDRISVIKLK